MRVIAGEYRSRPLRSLGGRAIRPTADRLRETLFNVLAAARPQGLAGTVWLDLYAGTGAVGIEALSRGAGMVYFVESSAKAAELIRENLASLKIASGYEVMQRDVGQALRTLEERGVAANYCFLDPPYRLHEPCRRTLEQLGRSSLAGPESVVIAEHEKKFDPGEDVGGLKRFRLLLQGDAGLSFYRKIE
jgi:16S rRNA (guanine(966)-N(2))-methyltransferase RsmD